MLRATLWAAILALLLRAAVPMLAVGAAQLRDVPLGSVCTVYGVVLPGAVADADRSQAQHQPGDPGPGAGHAADHCTLTALAQLGAGHDGTVVAARGKPEVGPVSPRTGGEWVDANAAWMAQRKQGPPARA